MLVHPLIPWHHWQIGEFDYTNITKEQINDIVTKISNIMLDSATSCKLVKKVGTKNNNVQNFKKNKDKNGLIRIVN